MTNTPAGRNYLEVWTEGKTDWKILKKASERLGIGLDLRFHETDSDMGDKNLLQRCKTFAEKVNETPIVYIFDREDKSTITEVAGTTGDYKDWGNNVYSFVLPVPEHRLGHENISIEFYFTDPDLKTSDASGRRLYLTSEFSENSGRLLTDPNISIGTKGFLKGYTAPDRARIVGSDVHDATHGSIALSKADFAERIVNNTQPFDNLDFGAFVNVFNVLAEIWNAAIPKVFIYFPPPTAFYESIKQQPTPERLSNLYDYAYGVLTIALQIFCITAIRCYEDDLLAEPKEYYKKARQIKKLLSENFRWPSFGTWVSLANQCCHLVDKKAPHELTLMKVCLESVIVLEDIGRLINDLENLFPPSAKTPIFVKKQEIRDDLIRFVLPELVKYSDITRHHLVEKIEASKELPINPDTWLGAILSASELIE
jgi:hypothetical protein